MTAFVARLHAGSRTGLDFPGCGQWATVSCRRRAGDIWCMGGVSLQGRRWFRAPQLLRACYSSRGLRSLRQRRWLRVHCSRVGRIWSCSGIRTARVVHSTGAVGSTGTVRSSWSAMGGVWAVSCVGGHIRPALGRILRGPRLAGGAGLCAGALAWKRWALQARTQASCCWIDLKRGKKSSTKLV